MGESSSCLQRERILDVEQPLIRIRREQAEARGVVCLNELQEFVSMLLDLDEPLRTIVDVLKNGVEDVADVFDERQDVVFEGAVEDGEDPEPGAALERHELGEVDVPQPSQRAVEGIVLTGTELAEHLRQCGSVSGQQRENQIQPVLNIEFDRHVANLLLRARNITPNALEAETEQLSEGR